MFLTVGDIAQLVVLLEQQLGKKGLFDYNNLLNSTVGALKLALADKIIYSDSEEASKRRKTSGTPALIHAFPLSLLPSSALT